MKGLLFSAAVFFFATVGLSRIEGQTPRHSPSLSTASGEVDSAFLAEVQHQLSSYPGGQWLYQRCDGFSRWINYKAELSLTATNNRSSVNKRNGSIPLAEGDTDVQGDISRSIEDENEPSISINRRDPKLIVAGANDIKWSTNPGSDSGMNTAGMPAYVTTDGGYTWNTYRLPVATAVPGAEEWGDPMIVCDNSGMFYYSFLMYPTTIGASSDLLVARSTDGIHWTLGNPVIGTDNSNALEDKETIAVDNDPESPYYGRLYIAWTEYPLHAISLATPIVHEIAHSDDHGMTWSKPVPYTSYYGDFALLRVGQRGTIFISSMHYFDSEGNQPRPMSHGMTVSTDGGSTFQDHAIHDFSDYPLVPTVGRDGLKGEYGFRAKPYPSFDVDTGNTLRAVFGSYDSLGDDAELFETTSTDLAKHWSVPKQIGTPRGMHNDHYIPWVSIDPKSHASYVSMVSSEADTLNLFSQAVWCSYYTPSNLEPMGSDLFNPLLLTASHIDFLGDYATSDAYDGYFAASWTENRQPAYHDGEIFAYVSGLLPRPSSDVVHAINADEFNVGELSPDPASGNSVSLTVASNAERSATIRVFDLKGNEMVDRTETIQPSESNGISLDIHSLPAGVYHVLIQSGQDAVDRNLIILR